MSETSRRSFLIAAGAGAAVAATAGVVGRSGDPAAGDPVAGAWGSGSTVPAGGQGPLVAYVHDVDAGEVAVMVGESEVVITDRVLVAKLLAVHSGA